MQMVAVLVSLNETCWHICPFPIQKRTHIATIHFLLSGQILLSAHNLLYSFS